MKRIYLIGLLATVLLAGCGYRAEVESNTYWSGTFAGKYVEGYGDHTISMHPYDDRFCIEAGKDSFNGYLKITIYEDDLFGMFFGISDETAAPYGEIYICND